MLAALLYLPALYQYYETQTLIYLCMFAYAISYAGSRNPGYALVIDQRRIDDLLHTVCRFL